MKFRSMPLLFRGREESGYICRQCQVDPLHLVSSRLVEPNFRHNNNYGRRPERNMVDLTGQMRSTQHGNPTRNTCSTNIKGHKNKIFHVETSE